MIGWIFTGAAHARVADADCNPHATPLVKCVVATFLSAITIPSVPVYTVERFGAWPALPSWLIGMHRMDSTRCQTVRCHNRPSTKTVACTCLVHTHAFVFRTAVIRAMILFCLCSRLLLSARQHYDLCMSRALARCFSLSVHVSVLTLFFIVNACQCPLAVFIVSACQCPYSGIFGSP